MYFSKYLHEDVQRKFSRPPLNRVENFPLGEQNYDKIPDKIKIVVYKMYALSYTGTVLLQYPTVIDCAVRRTTELLSQGVH